MDVARHVHEEILVHLDAPRQHHLREALEQVAAHAPLAATSLSRPHETTPLVLKAGDSSACVDVKVDLSALDRKLQKEELETLREDQHAPTLDIAREEAVSLLKFAVPLLASILVEALANIVTNMLLGNVSKNQSTTIIAASSLSDVAADQVTAILFGGVSMAVDTMCVQSFGAKQFAQFWLFAQAGVLATLYCAPLIVLVFANGAPILVFLGQDPTLANLAAFFMRIKLVTFPFVSAFVMMSGTLIAQGVVVPLTVATLAGYVVSIPLAYVLGYKTALGYMGIPVADFANVLVQTIYVLCVLLKSPVFVESWPGWQWRQAHGLIKKLWPLGVSSVLMITFQNLSFNIVSFLCGLLPNAATAISSSSIGFAWVRLGFLPFIGFLGGSSVRVGMALGAGRPRRAQIATRVALALMLSTAAVSVVVCAVFADSFTHAYTTDKVTAKAATDLVYVLLPIIPLMACAQTAQAVFRASAKQLLSAQLNFVAMIVVGVPVGYLLGFQLSWGVAGLWSGQTLGYAIFIIAAGVWVLRQDWKQLAHTARLNAHLHVEHPYHEEPSPEPLTSAHTA